MSRKAPTKDLLEKLDELAQASPRHEQKLIGLVRQLAAIADAQGGRIRSVEREIDQLCERVGGVDTRLIGSVLGDLNKRASSAIKQIDKTLKRVKKTRARTKRMGLVRKQRKKKKTIKC